MLSFDIIEDGLVYPSCYMPSLDYKFKFQKN